MIVLLGCLNCCNCLVQSRTYAPTGNRDLEIAPTLRSGISIALTIRSLDGVGTGIKLQHDKPTFPKQIDRLNSYKLFILYEYMVSVGCR